MRWFDLVRVVHSTLYIQALWTYEKMLSVGYTICLLPFALRWFKDTEAQKEFLNRNLDFFNTHPYMVSWIVGASIKLEEESQKTGTPSLEQQLRFRRRMSEALAAIGDQLFWNRIKPLTALLGALYALYYGPAGIVIFLVAYNIPHFYHRIAGALIGYREGFNVMKVVSNKRYNLILSRLLSFCAFIAGSAFVLAADSPFVTSMGERIAFVGSAAITLVSLRYGRAVPEILILLLLGGTFIGFILN